MKHNAKGLKERVSLARMVGRIMIAGYFLAAALHLVDGIDLTLLTTEFFAPPTSDVLSASLLFIPAFLVMFGYQLRLMIGTIAVLVVTSSVLAVMSGHGFALGDLWQNLALIFALFLTVPRDPMRRRPRWLRRLGLRRQKVVPRRVRASATRAAPAVAAKPATPRRVSAVTPRLYALADIEKVNIPAPRSNIFADENVA